LFHVIYEGGKLRRIGCGDQRIVNFKLIPPFHTRRAGALRNEHEEICQLLRNPNGALLILKRLPVVQMEEEAPPGSCECLARRGGQIWVQLTFEKPVRRNLERHSEVTANFAIDGNQIAKILRDRQL